MHGICCGSVSCVDRAEGAGGGGVGGWGGYCPLFPRRCQQYVEAWICSGLADGPSPVSGQPACQQHSLLPRTQCSACCAARGTPQLLLPCVSRSVPPPPSPILSWTLSSCQHAKQSERVYLRRDLDASPDAFWVQKFGVGGGCRRVWGGGGDGGEGGALRVRP